jgi:GDP-L-fucose synthase
MKKNSKIYVAGHLGMVGSALTRGLIASGYRNLVCRSSQELDLCNQAAVEDFFRLEKPEYVFVAAAKVGGIYANMTYPADFIYNNLMIQSNLIDFSFRHHVKKLLFLGSSCIYPKYAPQPITEEYLLTGKLEPTNEPYAIAKIAGIKMCQAYNRQYGTDFIAVMPTNLYGINDNFDLNTAHVLPALLRKIHEAKMHALPSFKAWGSGTPKREFLYVDDLADACLFIMNHYHGNEIINIGTGEDISIKDLVYLVQSVIGFNGEIQWDPSKPDGTPRKLLDISKLTAMGWKAKVPLSEGIRNTYEWYLQNKSIRD